MPDAQFNFLFGVVEACGGVWDKEEKKAATQKRQKNLCDDNKNHIFIRISKTPEIHLYPNNFPSFEKWSGKMCDVKTETVRDKTLIRNDFPPFYYLLVFNKFHR